MFGQKSVREKAGARYRRLFERAIKDFDGRMRAIVASQRAKGVLKSGATIKAAVRATSEATYEAIQSALAGIGSVTSHAGGERVAMMAELREALAEHHAAIEARAGDALGRVGLGSDVRHAARLFAEERGRHEELIDDFVEGWAAPTAKPWTERHPVLFLLVTILASIALGWVAKSLIGEQWQEEKLPSPPAKQAPAAPPGSQPAK
ncbi:hypothetical protein [Sphingopyxis sp.]|uniref:hypothetical protein n=1 Tax=Sphingopyxis sp. TaxID=1908224 RepID=UPI002B48C4A8|nr:hypothetical protein [Sphingopyxis sp.]HJS13172.1 hypothetical protein [Sphingopyxis sp.]